MKLSELKNVIRKTIKSEVRTAIREELTEIMVGKQKTKGELSSLVDDLTESKSKSVYKKSNKRFAKNNQLNEILNQTVGFNGTNSEPDSDQTMTFTSNDASNLRGRFENLVGYESGGKNLNNNLAQTAAAMGKAPEEVSPDVAKALTRNYGDVMAAIDKKKQGGGPLKG